MISQQHFFNLLSQAELSEYAFLYEPLSRYCTLLLDWNNRMNLTAITEDEAVAVKHFIDSLLPLKLWNLPQGASVIDVGTGAGFPGVVLSLARPDLQMTLLDSLQKRLTFLDAVCTQLEARAALVHARAEDAGRAPAHRAQYDLAVSRAVANLASLAEYCLPLVKTGGVLLAMKGSSGREECAAAQNAIALCGGKIEQVIDYALPGGDPRTLVVVRKISQTPAKYPRTAAKISKNPL